MSKPYRFITDERLLSTYENHVLRVCAHDDAAFRRVCNRSSMPSLTERADFRADIQTWRDNHPDKEQK